MTVQAAQKKEFQGTTEKTPKPQIVIDNTIQDKERDIARSIISSGKPLIIITDANAQAWATMAERMNDALPNVPIVFETDVAEKIFFSNVGSSRGIAAQNCVGHFEKVNGYSRQIRQTLCEELQQSDCIMVFGTPSKDLTDALQQSDCVYINKTQSASDEIATARINMALIVTMERPSDQWKYWRDKTKEMRPSF